LKAIAVNSVGGINQIKEYVVEKGLEGGDGGALNDKQGGEGVGSCNA